MIDPRIKGFLMRLGPVLMPATAITLLLFLLMALIVTNRQPTTLLEPMQQSGKIVSTAQYTPAPLVITARIEKPYPKSAFLKTNELPETPALFTGDYQFDYAAVDQMELPVWEPAIDRLDPVRISMDHDAYLINGSSPTYPMRAYRSGVEGHVVLAITVSETGRVTDATIIEASPRGYFEAVAINAALKLKYKPRIENGKAVTSNDIQYRWDFFIDK